MVQIIMRLAMMLYCLGDDVGPDTLLKVTLLQCSDFWGWLRSGSRVLLFVTATLGRKYVDDSVCLSQGLARLLEEIHAKSECEVQVSCARIC